MGLRILLHGVEGLCSITVEINQAVAALVVLRVACCCCASPGWRLRLYPHRYHCWLLLLALLPVLLLLVACWIACITPVTPLAAGCTCAVLLLCLCLCLFSMITDGLLILLCLFTLLR
jgi:hypothetical protein